MTMKMRGNWRNVSQTRWVRGGSLEGRRSSGKCIGTTSMKWQRNVRWEHMRKKKKINPWWSEQVQHQCCKK